MNDTKSEWVHCNECVRTTDHIEIFRYRNKEFSEDLKNEVGETYISFDGFSDWFLMECQGCKSIHLRHEEYFSEWLEPGDNGLRTSHYPKRNFKSRIKPNWVSVLDSQISLQGHFILISYRQIYELLDVGHNLAAMLVCRALLETIAIENGEGDKQTFREKLQALSAKGILGSSQVDTLNHIVYDAGSAVMHRGYNPTEIAVHIVLDSIEKLLHTIYVEPEMMKNLSANLPKRSK